MHLCHVKWETFWRFLLVRLKQTYFDSHESSLYQKSWFEKHFSDYSNWDCLPVWNRTNSDSNSGTIQAIGPNDGTSHQKKMQWVGPRFEPSIVPLLPPCIKDAFSFVQVEWKCAGSIIFESVRKVWSLNLCPAHCMFLLLLPKRVPPILLLLIEQRNREFPS